MGWMAKSKSSQSVNWKASRNALVLSITMDLLKMLRSGMNCSWTKGWVGFEVIKKIGPDVKCKCSDP
ncbi:plastidial pyruvate kinase 1, chloroplastic-like isoform X2 [Physcomitrium patens]|uniref:plastidial pyruvate kinase 1, chloroplastic-like isoform X2 n=1 Tax=Physcomitrium patens TaxID=3218 RepID=UPI003CCD0C49